MKKYELMYIVKDGLDEEARKAEIEKLHGILTSNGAKLGEVKEWGLRNFAYPINTNSYTITGLTENTTYQVQVQANCGDGNLSDWSSAISVTTVGINSWLESSVNLYPNPAKEYVDIRVDGDLNVSMMEVYDVYGKLINTVTVVDNPTRINVSNLANGMYFVRVTTEAGKVTKSFVKK